MAITFDPLRFARTLGQAETISTAVHDARKSADVATKGDVAELRTEVKADIRELSAKVDLIKWRLGIILVAVLAPLIKSLF